MYYDLQVIWLQIVGLLHQCCLTCDIESLESFIVTKINPPKMTDTDDLQYPCDMCMNEELTLPLMSIVFTNPVRITVRDATDITFVSQDAFVFISDARSARKMPHAEFD